MYQTYARNVNMDRRLGYRVDVSARLSFMQLLLFILI